MKAPAVAGWHACRPSLPPPPDEPLAMPTSPAPLRPSSLLAMCAAAVAGVAPLLVTPTFRELFAAMGTELPALTVLVLEGRVAFVALPVLAVAALLLRPGRGTALAVWAVSALALALTIIGLYLPVFALAGAV